MPVYVINAEVEVDVDRYKEVTVRTETGQFKTVNKTCNEH